MATILLAEDDKTSRTLMYQLLKDAGHHVIASPNGQHAWEALECNTVDLILTDIMMPKLDGRELIKKIRRSKQHKHLPIIMISGVIGLKEIRNLLESGVTRFLPKPVNTTDLFENVNACLEYIFNRTI